MLKFLIIFIVLIFSSPIFAQDKTGFAIDINANNIAGLFTMTDENGRLRNLDLMEGVFKDGSLGFKAERYHNVPSNFIYSKMADMASKLDGNGTLLLYLNSHGGGSGNRFIMSSSDGNFRFSKAIAAIAKVKTVRRLVFLVDTCHAAGSIQESLKEDGQLLRDIQIATPTEYLPEMPDRFSFKIKPFAGIFSLKNDEIDFCEDSGAYEEILIISSSSVEDLSTRGVFASRLSSTFNAVKEDKEITLAQFLKKFADSHGKSGQQPYYKVLPNRSMLSEFLFGPLAVQQIPVKNYSSDGLKDFPPNYILYPAK